MLNETVALHHADFNEVNRRWNIGLLKVKNSKLKKLELNGSTVNEEDYEVGDSFIQFNQQYNYQPDKSYIAFIDFDIDKTRRQFNTAIVVAIIGLVGTLFTPIYPDLKCLVANCSPSEDLVYFVGAKWEYDDDLGTFDYVMGIREIENKGSFVPRKQLRDEKIWVALRKLESKDPEEHFFATGADGPHKYRSGGTLSIRVDKTLCEKIKAEEGGLQAVMILAKKGIELNSPFRLSNYGENARLLKAPAVGISVVEKCI
jgi:hypothetical protein